jgi:protein-disulfide isomerase
LPFHANALPAARVAQGVRDIAGSAAAFEFFRLSFENQRLLAQNLDQWAEKLGAPAGARAAGTATAEAAVDRDMELATAIGVSGTPDFRINGTTLNGAHPVENFRKIIDQELTAAGTLLGQGVAPGTVYARRVAANFKAPAPAAARVPPPGEAAADTTVYKLPVDRSPALGPADALVTIVTFSEFQCPFCKRVQPTLQELLSRHPGDVRIVFKHNPLPFHPRAMPAAMLAIEARAQRGDAAFWQAHDRLFESAPALEDESLLAVARELKLNGPRVRAALARQSHKPVVLADQDLADDVEAGGTPHFFINGRRLVGAQPIEEFERIVREELEKARALVAAGTPRGRVYDELMKGAVGSKPPETRRAPPVTAASPSKGPARAPVVIQIFSDFECPFCRRVLPTLKTLEKEFPGQVRFVWRNLPLPFHPHARLAATAGLEAHAQGGSRAFWRMHDMIFESQEKTGGEPSRENLELYAQRLRLDMARFRRALDEGVHGAGIDRDLDLAHNERIRGTPSFLINDYFLSGAQPVAKFRKLIRRALDDAKAGKKP